MAFVVREWPGIVYKARHEGEIITPPEGFFDACSTGDLLSLLSLLGGEKKSPKTKAPPTSQMLQKAVTNNHVNIVDYLLEWDPSVEIDYHVLFRAASNYRVEMYEYFYLRNPAIIHWTFHTYGDAVITATSTSNIRLLRFLLDHGANPGSGLRPNLMMARFSALDMAVSRSSEEAVKLLVDRGAEVSNTRALQSAAGNGQIGIVRILLDAGADVNKVFVPSISNEAASNMGSALHEAVRTGQVEVVQLLLETGADQNVLSADRKSAITVARELLISGNLSASKSQPVLLGYHFSLSLAQKHKAIVAILEEQANSIWRTKEQQLWRRLRTNASTQKQRVVKKELPYIV
ncbi:hypothetical protein MMC19_002931 [Ptychographa xylographoides]|nr:hypothetical protein [Ptychographa xylographoides]